MSGLTVPEQHFLDEVGETLDGLGRAYVLVVAGKDGGRPVVVSNSNVPAEEVLRSILDKFDNGQVENVEHVLPAPPAPPAPGACTCPPGIPRRIDDRCPAHGGWMP